MAQIDLGKVKQTDEEFDQKINDITGGLKFGQDEEGKWGYIIPSEEGADTVIPFSVGGGVEGFDVLVNEGKRESIPANNSKQTNVSVTLGKKYKCIVVFCVASSTDTYTTMGSYIKVDYEETVNGVGFVNVTTSAFIRAYSYIILDADKYQEGSVVDFSYFPGNSRTSSVYISHGIIIVGLY